MDHETLAFNRFEYEIYRDTLQKDNPSLNGFLSYRRTAELYPDETNAAEWLRTSRPYILALGAVALLMVWLVEPSYLAEVLTAVIGYLLLSYAVYPKLLDRRG